MSSPVETGHRSGQAYSPFSPFRNNSDQQSFFPSQLGAFALTDGNMESRNGKGPTHSGSPSLFIMTPVHANSKLPPFSPFVNLPQEGAPAGITILDADPLFSRELIQKVDLILKKSKDSQEGLHEVEGGTSHAILIGSKQCPIALFKSEKRELGTDLDKIIAKHNRFASKLGITPGSGAFREYLAFTYIRQFFALANISPSQMDVADTAYVQCASEGLYILSEKGRGDTPFSVIEPGSLHAFIPDCVSCKTAYCSVLSISPYLVHLLAVLDLILMNSDRNNGNLLIQKNADESIRLLLIDHAAILPADGESAGIFIWLYWPQMQIPISEEVIAFINKLSPNMLQEIIERLRKKGLSQAINFSPESLQVHELAIQLLQRGIRNGLSLYEIAILFTKTSFREKEDAIFLSKEDGVIFLLCKQAQNREFVMDELLTTYKAKLDELKQDPQKISLLNRCIEAKKFAMLLDKK